MNFLARLFEALLPSTPEWVCAECGDSMTEPPHSPVRPCPKLPAVCMQCGKPRPIAAFWCSDECREAWCSDGVLRRRGRK